MLKAVFRGFWNVLAKSVEVLAFSGLGTANRVMFLKK